MHEIDLTGVKTVKEFHERIKKSIRTPSWYGDNLDALADVFSEMSGRIIVKGSEAVDDDMTAYVDRFKMMCVAAREENIMLEVLFL